MLIYLYKSINPLGSYQSCEKSGPSAEKSGPSAGAHDPIRPPALRISFKEGKLIQKGPFPNPSPVPCALSFLHMESLEQAHFGAQIYSGCARSNLELFTEYTFIL